MKTSSETRNHAADVTRGRTATNRATANALQVLDEAGNDFYPTLAIKVGSATDLGNNVTAIGVGPVEGLLTDETDTTLVPHPDGTGGVVWGVDATGSADAELNIEGGQSVIKAHGSMGATETFDPTDGNVHTGTLDANLTVTLNAPTGTGAATLELYITASGTRTWTWPGSVVWPDGVTPSPPADTLLKRLILETLDGGTTWYGVEVGGVVGTSASDTNIWRPVLDGSGLVIADGAGQAVMAYGPA